MPTPTSCPALVTPGIDCSVPDRHDAMISARTLLQRLWRFRWWIASALFGMTTAAIAVNFWILSSTNTRVFRDLEALPQNDVGLVLGARRVLAGGHINSHFRARIEAAARLYSTGKVRHLLLSGDNHVKGYDEPTDMKQDLLALGVPETAMTLDYAGFRTLDSVVRARKVFGQEKLTIITDDFHVHRAVFLARHSGVDAIAYTSETVALRYSAKTRVRECVARVKAVLDLFVLHRGPRFLGPQIEIRVDDARSACS